MGEKDNYEAAEEARRDLAAHPRRPWSHENTLIRYLSGAAYRVAHDGPVPDRLRTHEPRTDEPRPGEPV